MKLWDKSGLTEQLIQFLVYSPLPATAGSFQGLEHIPHPRVSLKCKCSLACKQQLLEWLVSRALGGCGRYTGTG